MMYEDPAPSTLRTFDRTMSTFPVPVPGTPWRRLVLDDGSLKVLVYGVRNMSAVLVPTYVPYVLAPA